MNSTRKAVLVSAGLLFAYFQFAGLLGFLVGFQGSAVLYNGWAGYFIGVGIAATVALLMGALMVVAGPVYEWIRKDKSDEADKPATTATTVFNHYTPPATPVLTTVRKSTSDDVPVPVSRREARMLRELERVGKTG